MRVFPNIKQILYGITVVAFLYVTVFALPSMAMTHHHDGMPMSNCPFMVGEAALCEMNVLDHIASWQAMFTVLPPVETFVLLLLSLLLAFVALRFLYDPPDTAPPQRTSYKVEPTPSLWLLLLGSTISSRAP